MCTRGAENVLSDPASKDDEKARSLRVLRSTADKLERVSDQLKRFRINYREQVVLTSCLIGSWFSSFIDQHPWLTNVLQIKGGENNIVVIDTNRLHDIIEQLCWNSREYFRPTECDKELRIVIEIELIVGDSVYGLHKERPYLRFGIYDNGPGIPEGKRKGLFGVGVQRWSEVGTGLGLVLCRVIMEQLDGEIRLAVPAPRGARFELYFPQDIMLKKGESNEKSANS
jgi:signal transduction histidine kinase